MILTSIVISQSQIHQHVIGVELTMVGKKGENKREDEVLARPSAGMRQDHRKSRHARRDHQLRSVPPEAS